MSIILANLLVEDAGDLGVLSSAGVATVAGAFSLAEAGNLGTLASAGEAIATGNFNQDHKFVFTLAGVATVAGDPAVSNTFAKGIEIVGQAYATILLTHERVIGTLASAGVATAEDVFLRANDEPNRFLTISTAGVGEALVDTKREVTTVAQSAGVATVSATFGVVPADFGELAIFLDLLPAQSAGVRHFDARLLVNGLNIPIRSFRYNAPASGSGDGLEVELSKPDLAQIDDGDTFEMQIGLKASGDGAPTWITLIEGVFGSRNYSISYAEDTLRISAVASFADKLRQAPRSSFILYDPAQAGDITIDETDLLRDTLGNVYGVDFEPAGNLTLHDVFDRAFVTGCGFSAVLTNIPAFPVARVDFSTLSTYQDAVAGLIGPFEPVFFDLDGALWIIDVTAGLPSSLTPRPLQPARYQTLETSATKAPVDGLVLRYTEPNEPDLSFAVVTETDETETGSGDNYQKTVTTRTVRNYSRSDAPTAIVKRVLSREVIATYNADNDLIAETTADFTLDAFGNITQQRTRKRALIPELSAPYTATLDEIRDEIVTLTYRYTGRRPTLYKRVTQVTGLIAVDEENTYLDEPFKQEFGDAHRAGNLAEGMTTETGPIKTVFETFEPIGNGQTKLVSHTIDFLRKTSLRSESETVSGQAEQTAQKSRSLLVWRDGIDLNDATGKRVEDFAVGVVPLRYALPLARRRLARALAVKGEASAQFLGYDPAVRRGALFRIYGRSGASLGDHLVVGVSVAGDNLGTAETSLSTAIQTIEI